MFIPAAFNDSLLHLKYDTCHGPNIQSVCQGEHENLCMVQPSQVQRNGLYTLVTYQQCKSTQTLG